jgi:hypothetical protein
MRKFVLFFALIIAFFATPVFAGVAIIDSSCSNPIIAINYTEPSPVDVDLASCTAHIDVNGGIVFNKTITASSPNGGGVRSENHTVGGLSDASNNINVNMSCADLSGNVDGPTPTQTVNISCDVTGPGLPIF